MSSKNQAPSPSAIAMALANAGMSPDAAAPAMAPQAPNPFLLDQPLEQAAQPARAPMHPMVAAIMQRFGLLNMIRNQGNRNVVDPETPIQ